jgi:hypothetical protein
MAVPFRSPRRAHVAKGEVPCRRRAAGLRTGSDCSLVPVSSRVNLTTATLRVGRWCSLSWWAVRSRLALRRTRYWSDAAASYLRRLSVTSWSTEWNKANARWRTKAHRLRRSPCPRHRRNRPSRNGLRMTNPLLDSKLTHYPERGLLARQPRGGQRVSRAPHIAGQLPGRVTYPTGRERPMPALRRRPDHRRRPTSGIADELGRERTPERYSKNPVGVFRLRLRARRSRPERR